MARAEEEAGRTHTGEELGEGLQDRGGASLCGDRLEEGETSRHDGLVKYLTPEDRRERGGDSSYTVTRATHFSFSPVPVIL